MEKSDNYLEAANNRYLQLIHVCTMDSWLF